MMLLKEKLEWKDHQVCRIQTEGFHQDWIKPQGTDFLIGKDLCLELRDSTLFKGRGFSLLSLTSPYRIHSSCELVHIEFPGYQGQNQWAEVDVEKPGRLAYIDGCSNTTLLAPLRNGDPCLNYLYLPPGTLQSAHVHPTARIGMIAAGSGKVVFWDKGKCEELQLKPGMKFLLPRFMKHCFHTHNSFLSVLVFHPDSDGGPKDEMNPMFTRTYVQKIDL